MQEDEYKKKNDKHVSLEKKLTRRIVLLMVIVLVLLCVIIVLQIMNNRKVMNSAYSGISESAERLSSDAMVEQVQERLLSVSVEKAKEVDNYFDNLGNIVSMMAASATELYNHEGDYAGVTVYPPDMKNDGVLAVQVTYSKDANQEDPATIREQELLGTLQSYMLAIEKNNPEIASNYFATESGIMLQADRNSGAQFNADGTVNTFEAKERPWYKNAVGATGISFTDVIPDFDTGEYGVMCSLPIFKGGTFVAVAGAGMYLYDIPLIIEGAKIDKSGSAFIVDRYGRIIFSTNTEGETALQGREFTDLLASDNADLAALATCAINGESRIMTLDVDGISQFASCAPIETIDWSLVILYPTEGALSSTRNLIGQMDGMWLALGEETDYSYVVMLALILVVFIIFAIGAVILSRRIAKSIAQPVIRLTNQVSNIEGEHMTFSWEEKSNDEVDVLAEAFGTMIDRLKNYIKEITEITAEKERIGAELSVATRIQADMLPCIFPPFPDRKEFTIYASMDPAKEVGGDFYDFFMLEDNRLALVIADVSGKGVPAALFMVISKTLIKNQSQVTRSPQEILESVNNMLCENNAEDMFVTVWLAILDIETGHITAANGGHEYPAIYRSGESFELLKDKHGPVLGGYEGVHYKEYELDLNPGDTLFVYTDGVPEATDANNELFGNERMLEALNTDPGARPEDILVNVRAGVDAFVGEAPQFDDLTMLCLRYEGPQKDD